MWEIRNQTPFAAGYAFVRDRDGAEVWIVAVKATFLIDPNGATREAVAQEPVHQAPVFRGDPKNSSLMYDSDFYLNKPTTDVLLNGHAYAPNGRPVKQLDATMKVADIAKTLRVHGDRRFRQGLPGLIASEPEPFVKIPLVYERAYGGADPKTASADRPKFEPRNPAGVGFAPAPDQLAPNIEEAKGPLGGLFRGGAPAGFGPIASHWQPRVKHGGTYDEAWQKERLPLVPNDFDDRFYLSAPEDQQPKSHLKGGEPVELINLTTKGTLKFTLPRVALGFETVFSTGERERHRGDLHTVILEPDVPRVLMVWQTHLRCHPKILKLDRTVVTRKRVLNPPPGAGASFVVDD
jgi:hypothetical protein